jgi:hypothetical protein
LFRARKADIPPGHEGLGIDEGRLLPRSLSGGPETLAKEDRTEIRVCSGMKSCRLGEHLGPQDFLEPQPGRLGIASSQVDDAQRVEGASLEIELRRQSEDVFEAQASRREVAIFEMLFPYAHQVSGSSLSTIHNLSLRALEKLYKTAIEQVTIDSSAGASFDCEL